MKPSTSSSFRYKQVGMKNIGRGEKQGSEDDTHRILDAYAFPSTAAEHMRDERLHGSDYA